MILLIKVMESCKLLKLYYHLQGLKTGMYYLRTKPAANPIQFTVDKSKLRNNDSISSASTVNTQNTSIQSPNKDDNNDNVEKRNQLSQEASKNLEMMLVCSRKNGEACMSCSS